MSALNFIFPYQDIKIKSIDELISQSLIRPLDFCANLYNAGVYDSNQECPWGDNLEIVRRISKDKTKILFTPNHKKFYEENSRSFKNDGSFFRDCLNQYIQGFLDDFNCFPNLPFKFSPNKHVARKIALKNKNEIIL